MSYQGLLTTSSGAPIADGNHDLTFKLYTVPTGGAPAWTETQSNVPVSKGTFNVILGATASLSGVNFNQQLYLGVTIATDPEFSPRSVLTSAPYALAPWSLNGSSISYNAGNVGIGTTTPGSQFNTTFDVVGRASFRTISGDMSKAVEFDNVGSALRIYAGTTQATGPDLIIATFPYNGDQLVLQASSGNVGIGTTSPSEKLEVAGDAKIQGTLFASNVSSNSPLSLQTAGTTRMTIDDVTGSVGIGTTTPGSGFNTEFDVVGRASFRTISGDMSKAVGFDNVGGSLRIYAASTDATNPDLIIATFPHNLDQLVLQASSGNVGIGTTSPSEKLEVAGDAKIQGTLFASNVSSNSSLSLQTAGTTRMTIDDVTGSVGIATTTPGSMFNTAFDVVGRASFRTISGDMSKAVAFDEVDGSLRIYAATTEPTGPDLVIATYPHNGDQLVLQASSGNVGIGTTSPSEKLEVAGNIKVGNATIRTGTGNPEGVVTGKVGDLFLRTDGGSGSTLYVKESGNGTNTGWAGK
jgi:ethanolamine utilization microcompartment shell protein EutS